MIFGCFLFEPQLFSTVDCALHCGKLANGDTQCDQNGSLCALDIVGKSLNGDSGDFMFLALSFIIIKFPPSIKGF